jgi:serine protease Do
MSIMQQPLDASERSSVRCRCLLLAAWLATAALGAPCGAAPGPPAGYAALVRRAAPSVVTVLVEEERKGAGDRAAEGATARNNPDAITSAIRRLLSGLDANPNGDEGAGAALGSGFVIRADGLIVTNRHVIAGAHAVRVRLAGGQEVAAKIVGADSVTDIALLSVAAGVLPALRLGSSESVSVGDEVLAIGNPFGLGQTVTAGIISARARTLEEDPYIDFLQTDAAINRGNSGGPLLSTDGTVIGVTSIIFTPSGGSIGLGFAIPAETVATVVAELEAHGAVDRGYLGVSAQESTATIATALGMQAPAGALITAVDPQGPAAGTLLIGDVLLDIGQLPVTFKNLSKITARLKPDALVAMTVRRDGADQTVALKVGRLPLPPEDPSLTGERDTWVAALMLGVAETTVQIRKEIKAEDEGGGLIVTQLRPSGPGALAGLRVGDLITHIGAKPVGDPAEFLAVPAPTPQAPVLLRVVHDSTPVYVAITGAPPLP